MDSFASENVPTAIFKIQWASYYCEAGVKVNETQCTYNVTMRRVRATAVEV
jgi:hypothetical protein